jgi:fructan beta-fructosidase
MKTSFDPRNLILALLVVTIPLQAAEDIIIADFEGATYGDWKVEGEAFGSGPAAGSLGGQMHVSGFEGKGLVNSFHEGDGTTGVLTSPPFKVERPFLSFLIGGGGHAGETCVNLLVDGKTVRTAAGPNTDSGGSEALEWASWDVADLAGKEAMVQIVDAHKGGWGHINFDYLLQGEARREAVPVTFNFTAEKRYLHLPVRNGAPKRRLKLFSAGKAVRELDIEFAPDGESSFLTALDLAPWKGSTLTLDAGKVAPGGTAPDELVQSDELPNSAGLYKEKSRPLFHFTSKIGWLNDPNGLVYHEGEWHLYYQHNPYGWNWGNMHWGHAVSKDLFHWEEIGDAIYPWSDCVGAAFSGSAVIDHANTSGFGKDGKPPLVVALTDTGAGESIAYSNDHGRTLTLFEGNPVVKHKGRDPKVIWHAPSKHWVMALYDEFEDKHWMTFQTSTDLRSWEFQSRIEGYFECPDIFELSVDGNSANTRWVIYAADGQYATGRFDGKVFTPEHEGKHRVWWGNFYAAQTYDNAPDGRRVQIGWGQGITFPGMPFNQQMVVPVDLSLRNTAHGVRLFAEPVAELDSLRGAKIGMDTEALDGTPRTIDIESPAFDMTIESSLNGTGRLIARVRGADVIYDATAKTLTCGDKKAPLENVGGQLSLRILVDMGSIEIFANDGTVALSHGVQWGTASRALELTGEGATDIHVTAYPLKSVWE